MSDLQATPLAAVENLVIEQGVPFNLNLVMLDENGDVVPMDGLGIRFIVRPAWSSSLTLLDTWWGAGAPEGLVSDISWDSETGEIDVDLTPAQTLALTWERGVYELLLYDNNGIPASKLLKGNIRVQPGLIRNVNNG